ncbi:terpenoid synthase [Leucogyrophana mollusca]|uniref:Terpenoid synthase n=1 Tax=Leucogyrophana mollusca TaxID=85980 RepID=A0ACB8AW49_9AGAM|nr:terpenoid synthase [Leucogyrophana mollusca]
MDTPAEEPKAFYFPDTMANWPWPRAINPHFEEIKEASDGWFRSFKAFRPQSQKAFERCDFCAAKHLRTACDLINVYFIIDEYTDVESGDVTGEMIEVAIDALNHPHKPRPKGEVLIGEVVRQFWELAIQTACPTSQSHFITHFTDYLHSVVAQAADRDLGYCRTIEEYLAVRRDNIGTHPAFAILHLGFDISDDIYYHPVVHEMKGYVTNILIVDNDVLSYNRERATGDENHNLLTVIMHELHVDLAGAVEWAVNFHTEMEQKFISSFSRLPSWGPTIDRQVKEYLDGVANWARGNVSWSFECRRYFGEKGREIEKSRLIPLLPKVKLNPELHKQDVVVANIVL